MCSAATEILVTQVHPVGEAERVLAPGRFDPDLVAVLGLKAYEDRPVVARRGDRAR